MESGAVSGVGDTLPNTFRVGDVTVARAVNEIRRPGGATEKIPPLAMDVLVFLASRPGEVIAIQELMTGVWGDRVVGDNALYNVIALLRRVLDDQERPYRVIETVARRGYRLAAPVQVTAASKSPPVTPRRFRVIGIVVLVIALPALLYGYLHRTRPPVVNSAPDVASAPPVLEQYRLGRYYLQQRSARSIYQAMEHFEKALEADAGNTLAMVGLCDAQLHLVDMGRVNFSDVRQRCETLLERALQRQPDLPDVHASLGLMQYWSGQQRDALVQFEKALSLDANHLNALHWSAVVLHELGEFERALARHIHAATIDPLSVVVQRGIALDLLALGDISGARTHFQRALELQPEYLGVEFDRLSYRPLTRALAQDAVSWAERNAAKLDGNAAGMVSVALLQLSLGNTEGAQRQLNAARALNADLPYLHYALAVLHFQAGRDDEALAALQWRAEHAPERALYKLPVALMRGLVADPESALSAIRTLYPDVVEPERIEARDFAALKYYALFQRRANDPGIERSIARLRELLPLCASCDAMTEAELLGLEKRYVEANRHADEAEANGWVPNYELVFWGRKRNPFFAFDTE